MTSWYARYKNRAIPIFKYLQTFVAYNKYVFVIQSQDAFNIIQNNSTAIFRTYPLTQWINRRRLMSVNRFFILKMINSIEIYEFN